jgi:hypothetical protein
MLRSQAELRGSVGSREMSVFQMLSAGNIGQFGAPGTVVPRIGCGARGAGLLGAALFDGCRRGVLAGADRLRNADPAVVAG